MYAGSLGINPGDYLNPDGSVSIGLLPTAGSINDGVTASGFITGTLTGSAIIINSGGGGSASLPQTSTSCASNCQGGITAAPPYTPNTATIFKPASAPEFDLLGDAIDTNSVQAWLAPNNSATNTLTIPVGIFGVADVSTMLNTIAGLTTGGTVCTATNNGLNAGTGCTNTNSYATVTLDFSTTAGGSTLQSETFALINGLTQANILDGATSGAGTVGNYTVSYLGHSYTVDSGLVWSSTIHGGANANDTLVLDAQEFPVFEPFQSLYLTNVVVTDYGSNSTTNREILSAVSITPTPEPSTLLLLGAGLAVIGVSRFRKSVKA
jgi:hypothetical protein